MFRLLTVIALLAVAFGSGWLVGQSGLIIAEYSRTETFSVNEATALPITCPLARANFVQLSIQPATAQDFTYCKPGGDCVVIPAGLTFELGPYQGGGEFAAGQALGTVQTATGAATLQVEAQKRVL